MASSSFLTRRCKSRIDYSEKSAKPQYVITDENLLVPPMKLKTIKDFADHPSKWKTTDTVTTVDIFIKPENSLVSYSISTITDKKLAVSVTNRTESPHTLTNNTEIAESSIVTPEQSKFNKTVHTATLIMSPEGDLDLTKYLKNLLRTKESEQNSNIF